MKSTSVHIEPGALFSKFGYRWILELSSRKGRDVFSLNGFMH